MPGEIVNGMSLFCDAHIHVQKCILILPLKALGKTDSLSLAQVTSCWAIQ